jgi:hypothetical protein
VSRYFLLLVFFLNQFPPSLWSLILLSLFAAGVVDTGGNLPPVSTTLAKMVEKFAIGVADTGGKFATGVVDTGGAP